MDIIKIAHRGNMIGRNPEQENHPEYITAALNQGFHVEIDVWCFDDKWFLGHDEPRYPIHQSFLHDDRLVCHAKNIDALHTMLKNKDIHCFWHENDYCTTTSKGWVWKYPEIYKDGKIHAMCSDVIKNCFL
tara:strand:+ start:3433 stop:3825 length:393 start_codon:yes stop_codon:yes gene_type:complete